MKKINAQAIKKNFDLQSIKILRNMETHKGKNASYTKYILNTQHVPAAGNFMRCALKSTWAADKQKRTFIDMVEISA